MALALFTASEFKELARINVSDYDTEIGNLATMVSGAVETLLNRTLELPDSDVVEYHSGTGRGSMLRLRRYPITVLTSIYVDNSRVFDSTTLMDSSYYVTDAESGIVRLLDTSAFWTRGNQNIQVTYRGGYDASTLPQGIKLGGLLYALSLWNKAQDLGLSSTSLAGFSTSLNQKALPVEAMRLLDPYRRPIEYGDVL